MQFTKQSYLYEYCLVEHRRALYLWRSSCVYTSCLQRLHTTGNIPNHHPHEREDNPAILTCFVLLVHEVATDYSDVCVADIVCMSCVSSKVYLLAGDLMECKSSPWHVKMCTILLDPEDASNVPCGCHEKITGPLPWCLASTTNKGSMVVSQVSSPSDSVFVILLFFRFARHFSPFLFLLLIISDYWVLHLAVLLFQSSRILFCVQQERSGR